MDKEKLRARFAALRRAVLGKNCVCAACGADVFTEEKFCARCLRALPFNRGHICRKCGRRIGGDYPVCLECKAQMPLFEAARSAFCYEGDIVRLIKKFKTGGRELSEALAGQMAPFLREGGAFAGAQLLVCVPMTEAARRKRGYNQSALLAEELEKLCGIPFGREVLVKTRETEAQKGLGRRARADNLRGSFRVHERKACAGKTVVIVDDVMTTGATADAVAAALAGAGAKRVYLLTAASVPSRPQGEAKNVESAVKNALNIP